MSVHAEPMAEGATHPARIEVEPIHEGRNRITTAFRLILAFPHLILVGGPIAASLTWTWGSDKSGSYDWGAGGGVLGAAVGIMTLVAWFAILFTGRHPQGLWNLAAFYLRWRVRAVAYITLLRDEYPPFGEGEYPAHFDVGPQPLERDRLTVAFRFILALPHLLAVWVLGVGWACTTVIAWFAILLTGRYPTGLYRFGVGVLRWNTRVEAYLLLLHDTYPPFSFE